MNDTMSDTPSEDKNIDFDASIKSLQALLTTMEDDSLDLKQALDQYEKGVSLVKQCQSALDHAQQRVEEINQSDSV